MRETDKPIGGFQSSYEDSEFVVLGVPHDATASFRSGCELAPTLIREYASNLETMDPYTDHDIAEILIHDAGDLEGNYLENLELYVKKVSDDGKKLLVLGGEHSILAPIAKSYPNHLFIVFDAHADLRDEYMGDPQSHACAVRRLLDIIKPDQLILMGTRAVSAEERKYIEDNRIVVFWGHTWDEKTEAKMLELVRERLENLDGLYLSVDMDGFDPAYAPGVGNPEPLGLSSKDFFSLLQGLPDISAADINELNPKYDPSGTTSALAARLAMHILSR